MSKLPSTHSPGQRIAIRERQVQAGGKTRNVYDLIINLGVGKRQAVEVRAALTAALRRTGVLHIPGAERAPSEQEGA